MRILFGAGAKGDIVRTIQTHLVERGFPTGIDGDFGSSTAAAVKGFQSSNSLTPSGGLDENTWSNLMGRPIPEVSERSLQLTASFEGHGFGLAVGNFDGALVTWGIIGFTLVSGEIPSIVQAVQSSNPALVKQAFSSNTDELLQLMTADRGFQTSWANEHTVGGRGLAEPWKTMFASFGAIPEVQQEQLKHVRRDYLNPAIQTALKLGFTSELGLALCFDIHVQNGGIKPATFSTVLAELPNTDESDARTIVANAVADSALPRFQADVRSRKLTIATGTGNVHGRNYVLENWGLSKEFSSSELTSAVRTTAVGG
jgi:peptidoglycan hydrolase-like protein with peptidoglycan-binding domain